jgi:hypothetical protein
MTGTPSRYEPVAAACVNQAVVYAHTNRMHYTLFCFMKNNIEPKNRLATQQLI